MGCPDSSCPISASMLVLKLKSQPFPNGEFEVAWLLNVRRIVLANSGAVLVKSVFWYTRLPLAVLIYPVPLPISAVR